MYFIFLPHLTCASALPGETENPKSASFLLKCCMLFTTNTRNTLKYHLVTAEPPSSIKTIDWMHQTGPKILLSVTDMLYVNQVCHGVGHCVKDGSYSSSSLSESQWTVLMGYLTISTNVDAIKHITDDNFYSAPQCSHCKRCTSYSNSVRLSVCPSVRPSVCPSVRLSVTRRYCVKTTARSTVQFSLSDSKMCLVL